jgi:hypothetical protein
VHFIAPRYWRHPTVLHRSRSLSISLRARRVLTLTAPRTAPTHAAEQIKKIFAIAAGKPRDRMKPNVPATTRPCLSPGPVTTLYREAHSRYAAIQASFVTGEVGESR